MESAQDEISGGHEGRAALAGALAAVDRADSDLERDLAALVAVDTSFPPGAGYEAFADLIETLLPPLRLSATRVEAPAALWDDGEGTSHGARVNLVARAEGVLRDPCSIYFHVDTVPPGDGWTTPPLRLTRLGDRLVGRGAADMKGAIAAVLTALRCLSDARAQLRHSPVLLFCTDEEGGLYPGIRYLAEQGSILGHLLSFNGGAQPRIWGGCFGSLDLAIDIKGRAAHSGAPERGVNAIEAAMPVLSALCALRDRVAARISALPAPPGSPPLHERLTIAAIHAGGAKGSAAPGSCRIVVNRRYAPESDVASVQREIALTVADALDGGPATGHQIRVTGHLIPVGDPTGPHWPRWQAALAEGFGWERAAFSRWAATSSSDMGWVQNAGVREILLGGLSRPEANIHAADEFTTLSDLKALARSVVLYLADAFEPASTQNTRNQGENSA
jgi:succinyl-diaminopimelate desuccinylase